MKKIVIIKLGRSIATTKRGRLDLFRFEHLAKEIVLLQKADFSVVLVVSASGTCGKKEIQSFVATEKVHKGLIAAVGQAYVTAKLHTILSKHNLTVAEMLLTKADLNDSLKREQIAAVLNDAAQNNIVTIMNENDAVEFCTFGGNDYLASDIARLVNAHCLLLMTDVDGVFNHDMEVIHTFTKKYTNLVDIKKQNHLGSVGGMKGKIQAALMASEKAIDTWIVGGKTKNMLTRLLLQNEHIGTKIVGGAL